MMIMIIIIIIFTLIFIFIFIIFIRHSCRPPLCDFVKAEHSPIQVVKQYYAALLTENHSRLLLLTAVIDMPSWKRQKKAAALHYRSAVMVAACWTWQRPRLLEEDPWSLVSVADDRVTTVDKHKIVRGPADKDPCQRDRFMVKPKYDMPEVAANPLCLLGSKWKPFWIEWARRVRGGIGPVECRHGRNKTDGDISKPWHSMWAKFINREAQLAHLQDRAWHSTNSSSGLALVDSSSSSGLAVAHAEKPKKQVRRRSGLHLFRDQCLKRDKLLDLAMNRCSGEYWDRCKAEYDSLSSADQSYWENMSELEVIAKSGDAPSPSPSVQPQACSVEEVAVSTLAVVPTETACYSERCSVEDRCSNSS